jgi:hypothetical protein
MTDPKQNLNLIKKIVTICSQKKSFFEERKLFKF